MTRAGLEGAFSLRGYHNLTAICRVCCCVSIFSVGGLGRGSGFVLFHLTMAELLLRFHSLSTNDCRGSGPRRRCLHSSTVIRRLTSTSGLRHSPLPLLSSMRKWRTFFTDADPTSHRVRLWRGRSASSLFFCLFFHSFVEYRRLDSFKGPWPLLWGRGEMADLCPDRFGLFLRVAVFSVCSLLSIIFPTFVV